MTEKIIVDIEVNDENSIEFLKKKISELTKEFEKLPGGDKNTSAPKLLESLRTYKKALKDISGEFELARKGANKSLGGINEAAAFAEGSLGALRKRQKELNDEIQKVAFGTEEFFKLAAELRMVNKQVDDIKIGLGVNTFGKLSNQLAEINNNTKETNKALGQFKEIAGKTFEFLGGDLKDLLEGVIEFGKASYTAGKETASGMENAGKATKTAGIALKTFGGIAKGIVSFGFFKLLEYASELLGVLIERVGNFVKNTTGIGKLQAEQIEEATNAAELASVRFKRIYEDDRKSIEERRKALLDDFNQQKKVLDEQIKYQTERANDRTRNTAEELKALADLKNKELEMERSLQDNLKGLDDDFAQKEEERVSKQAEIRQAAADKSIEIAENEMERKQILAEREAAFLMAEAELLRDNEEKQGKRIELLKQAAQIQEAAQKQQIEFLKSQGKTNEALSAENALLEMQRENLQSLKEAFGEVAEIKNLQSEIDIKAINESAAAAVESHLMKVGEIMRIDNEKSEADKQRAKDVEQYEIQKQQAQLEFAAQTATGLISIMSSVQQFSKDQSKEMAIITRSFAVFQAVINSYTAYTAALASAANNALPGLAQTMAGINLAAGLAQAVVIAAAPLPGFSTGGLIEGTYLGRDSVVIAAHPGEVVLNPQQQQALGGAATFASIGVPGFATGGIVPPAVVTPQQSTMIASNMQQAPIYLSFTDFERERNRYTKFVDSSNII